MSEAPPPRGPAPAATPPPAEPREYSSDELFGPDRLIVIRHDGQPYRLQITRNNRLILQK